MCVCLHSRASVFAFAFVCCKVAFQNTCVYVACLFCYCILGHICYACMLVLLAACLRVHLFVATLRFIAHVCRLHVGFAFVSLVCSIVLVCLSYG